MAGILSVELKHQYMYLVPIVPADALAPKGAMPSTDTMLTTILHIFSYYRLR